MFLCAQISTRLIRRGLSGRNTQVAAANYLSQSSAHATVDPTPPSIAPEMVKRPRGSFSRFVSDYFRRQPDSSQSATSHRTFVSAGIRWGQMTQAEKQPYIEAHRKDLTRYYKLARVKQQPSLEDIELKKCRRWSRTYSKAVTKSRLLKTIYECGAPKISARNPFALFMQDLTMTNEALSSKFIETELENAAAKKGLVDDGHIASPADVGNFPGEPGRPLQHRGHLIGETRMKKCCNMWKSLSELERARYRARFFDMRLDYHDRMIIWWAQLSPTQKDDIFAKWTDYSVWLRAAGRLAQLPPELVEVFGVQQARVVYKRLLREAKAKEHVSESSISAALHAYLRGKIDTTEETAHMVKSFRMVGCRPKHSQSSFISKALALASRTP